MNIEWVIPCRFVEVHDNLGTIVGAGIDTFWLQELPAPIQMMLAVRLLAMADELGGAEHPVTSRIRDPRGNPLEEVSGQLAIGGESARPEWLAGITIASAVGFLATEEGTYTVEISVDEASASFPVHVIHGSPGTAPAGDA